MNRYDIECWSLVIGLLLWAILSLYIPGQEYYGPQTTNKAYHLLPEPKPDKKNIRVPPMIFSKYIFIQI
jgi:hypothetical protein